jgi:hypothetical protein
VKNFFLNSKVLLNIHKEIFLEVAENRSSLHVFAGMQIFPERNEEFMQKEEAQFCNPANSIVKIRSIANSDFRNAYVGVPVMHTGRRIG